MRDTEQETWQKYINLRTTGKSYHGSSVERRSKRQWEKDSDIKTRTDGAGTFLVHVQPCLRKNLMALSLTPDDDPIE